MKPHIPQQAALLRQSVSPGTQSIEVNASGVLMLREGGIVREHLAANTAHLQLE